MEGPFQNPGSADPRNKKTVELADVSDTEGILRVQNEWIKAKESLEENEQSIAKEGVLIYTLTPEELADAIQDKENHIIIVSRENGEVTGYVLSYSMEKWMATKPEWREGLELQEGSPDIFSEKTLYFRQVAVLSDSGSVGLRLEKSLFEMAKSQGYRFIVGDILEKPVENTKSMEFHTNPKIGFRKTGIVKDGDLEWALLCRELT